MRKLVIILLLMPIVLKAPVLNGSAKDNMIRHFENMTKRYEARDRINEIKTMEFTIELLKEYINLVDPSLMNVPIRQFILETGWFKSELFTVNNNIAGMKYPRIRKTTATDVAMGHAKYEHWTDSVDDYIFWRDHWKSRGYSTENYYQFLREVNYAASYNYEELLKNIDVRKFEYSNQFDQIKQSSPAA